MTNERLSPEAAAIRIANLLSTVMNVAAILHNEAALHETDPVALRSTFLWIADEMSWIASAGIRGATAGISWPLDTQARIERFRTAANAWEPVGSPPPEVVDIARDCLVILQRNGT